MNVSRLRHPTRDHMIVAAAGPLSNLLIAAILFAGLMIMKTTSSEGAELIYHVAAYQFLGQLSILVPLTAIAYHGVMLNLLLAVFNLIPVAPWMGRQFFPACCRGRWRAFNQIQSYGLILLVALLPGHSRQCCTVRSAILFFLSHFGLTDECVFCQASSHQAHCTSATISE